MRLSNTFLKGVSMNEFFLSAILLWKIMWFSLFFLCLRFILQDFVCMSEVIGFRSSYSGNVTLLSSTH